MNSFLPARSVLPVAVVAVICGTLSVPAAHATTTQTSPPPVPAQTAPAAADQEVAAPSRVDQGAAEPSDQFIVTFGEGAEAPGTRSDAYGRVSDELGIAVEEVRVSAGGAAVVRTNDVVPEGTVDDVVNVLSAHPAVQHVEPDLRMRPLATVNDPFYVEQWNLHAASAGLRVEGAWDLTRGDGQIIAVLDTGITDHNDLDDNVLPGYDFVMDPDLAADGDGRDPDASDPGDACANPGPDLPPTESSWHGTHVAGIAAAVGNNAEGIAGVAHEAGLLPLRVLGACDGYVSDTADAVRWAAGGAVDGVPANPTPARVINMSIGAEDACTRYLQDAIDFATRQGSVVVAAAGNEGQPAANVMPANCANVITVGASGPAGQSAAYSNFGPEVDVSAPGGEGNTGPQNILSTMNEGATSPAGEGYAYMQGTSMAAPHVAGVAALMLAVNPSLTPQKVEQILRGAARPLSGACSAGCGTGLVDASAAVAIAAHGAYAPSLRSASDFIAADAAGALWNYPSNGRGGFLPRVKIGSGWSSLKSGFVTDWNQDGVLDLVAQWTGGRLSVYPGRYAGGFDPAVTIGSGWGSYVVTVGKWRTSDVFPSIVASDPQGTLWHYGNPGGGPLSARTSIGSGWKGLYLTMADFDGDTRMDILAKRPDGQLVQYRSNGIGQFVSEPRRSIGSGWQVVDSMSSLTGFNGGSRQGIMTRLTDGRLAYYPFTSGVWGARTIEGRGWSTYNLFR